MPRRCALGCTPKITGGVLHIFPNPNKFPDQFKAWVRIVTGQDECNFNYKNMKICDRHFTEKDRNRNNRLNALAVPSLFLREQPIDPCGLSNSSSEQTCNRPEVSDNCQQSSSGKIDEKAMENSSLDIPEATDIQQSISGTSQNVTHNPLLEHNYYKPLGTSIKARRWNNKKISAVDSKKCVIYQKNIKQLRRQICQLKKQGKSLKSRLENAEKLFNKSYFTKLIKDMTPAAKIFTNMQYFHVGKKPKGRRFSLEEKVLSLSLYKRSPKCYSLMSKFFVLPSTKALKRLLAQIKLSPGINRIMFDKLKKTVSNFDTQDKLCTLIFDEMSIMPQLQYDSSNDELKGFTSHGKNHIANHALVFMVKGVKKQFKQPVAYFFTNSLSKMELKSIITEVIKNVQETGLIILCTVCDQSTVNVSAVEDLIKDTKSKYLRKGKEMPVDSFEINGKKSFHYTTFLIY